MLDLKDWIIKGDFLKDLVSNEFEVKYLTEEAQNYISKENIKFEEVERYGGEGQGEEYYIVFNVEIDSMKKYFKLDGWYQSYHGWEFNSYNNFYEVELKPVVKKEWVKC